MTIPLDWEERTQIAVDAAKALEIADSENNGNGILPSSKYMKAGILSVVADTIFYTGGTALEEINVLAFGDMIIVYYDDSESLEFLVVEDEEREDFMVLSENGKRKEVVTATNFHLWFANLSQWLQGKIGLIEQGEIFNQNYEDLIAKPVSLPDL